ncbi:MAG: quinol dehydrogenase ferredoxin subunit NapH [Thiobacillus sp.]
MNAVLETGRRPARPYTPPSTLAGKLWGWRYLMLRRAVQVGVLLMFFGTLHWGWKMAEAPLLSGNLSASMFLGVLPLADPFAVLQQLVSGQSLHTTVLQGAAILLVFFALAGRVFCGWVCPMNLVTDLAGWVREKLNLKALLRLSRSTRYWVMGLALVLSALMGVAAFEWVSPISMLHREIIYGVGMGLTAALGIFVFDLLIMKHGWCGHLCPLGAFYAFIGKRALLRVRFDDATCTHCGECVRVCPEPQVLNMKKAAEHGMVTAGACTNCARCIPVCPEDSLDFAWRWNAYACHSAPQSRTQP